MKKYELTDETITTTTGAKLSRISALRDIPKYRVKAGDLGGFIQSESNLSHNGDCWVYGSARVKLDHEAISVSGLRWNMTACPDAINIGCERMPMREWKTKIQDVAKKHNVEPDVAASYLRLMMAIRHVQRTEARIAKRNSKKE